MLAALYKTNTFYFLSRGRPHLWISEQFWLARTIHAFCFSPPVDFWNIPNGYGVGSFVIMAY